MSKYIGFDIDCKKIAIVAVARKLLSIMRAMLLGGELFNEELVNKADETTLVA